MVQPHSPQRIGAMEALFTPKRLAVIGVSPRPGNLGRNILKNLQGHRFQGEVFLVGRSGGEVEGMRIYERLADVPGDLDAAAILTPARLVPGILEECAAKGVRAAYVESGGFSEFGGAGDALSARVLAIARGSWGPTAWA